MKKKEEIKKASFRSRLQQHKRKERDPGAVVVNYNIKGSYDNRRPKKTGALCLDKKRKAWEKSEGETGKRGEARAQTEVSPNQGKDKWIPDPAEPRTDNSNETSRNQ